ncbi:MAG: family 16 glycosylhydrolase [Clostridia bacterium]|nr:family 16 glycosylhydrolase [Clostridia bacterium]
MKGFKSKIAVLLVLVIAFASLLSMVGPASALVGDYNGSGTLSTADAVYLLYHTLFGSEEYPITQDGDSNGDGKVDGEDATHLLFNILFGSDDYPLPYVNITLNNNGIVNTYDMLPGSDLNPLGTLYCDGLTSFEFDGWYNSDFTKEYTTVPDVDTTLYAKYDGYTAYSFDRGGYYDPNNRGFISAVDDPFGGEGKVLYTPIIDKNDSVTYGYYRALAPSANDGTTNTGFDFKKDHTYRVSFYYRFAESDPSGAVCSLEFYGVDPAGIHKNSYKTKIGNSVKLNNKNSWAYYEADVTNVTDNKHLYLRFLGGSSTVVYNFYFDNLVIKDVTPVEVEGIKLVNGGITETSELQVGDALPVLSTYADELSNKTFAFDGWYDQTLTKKYTTVDANVDTYYAKYNKLTKFSFEAGGIYDPNGRYSATSTGIPCWYREWDPVNPGNVVLRAYPTDGNNTHVGLSVLDGIDGGYTLIPGNQYVMTFNYYIENDVIESTSVSVRGSAKGNIGATGNKTESLGSCKLTTVNQWASETLYFTADSKAADSPYLIFMTQNGAKIPNLKLYFDNIIIREFDADEEVLIYTYTNEIFTNDNGVVTELDRTYLGAELPATPTYYGAESYGWYNATLNAKYSTIPGKNITMYAKYDGNVYNFENGGYYDPNGKFGVGSSKFEVVADPTDASNTVLKTDLKNDVGNKHFAFNASGYDNTDGYKLTVGNNYEISFMYYAENLNENGVSIQFRGCKSANIGITGGKSSGQGPANLKVEGKWTGVTVNFTYKGKDLTDEINPYLIMMVQDGSASQGSAACTATVYIDDVVIKETVPAKTYTANDVILGGWTLGYANRPLNIVVPAANFSYLAMMQCEELVEVIKGITSTSTVANIVFEDEWTEKENQANIFVGNVKGHSRDNIHKINTTSFGKDDYAYAIGKGNVYIDGGSTYALAMGISEFAKAIESASKGYEFAVGSKTTGVYSDKIDSYSSASYYRPAFLEDFDQDDIDTTIWNVYDKKESKARDIVDENGNIIYDGVIDDEKTPDEGTGHNWVRARSAKDTYLENGCVVFNGRYSKDHEIFYGGMLRTHNQMEFLYGYVETSCITQQGASLWSAVWMTPQGDTTGLYRPEIDINESFGNSRYSAFNMHSWPTTVGSNLQKPKYSLDSRDYNDKKADAGAGNTFNDGFHTFGVLWTPDGCKFTVDGDVQFEYMYNPTSKYYNNDIDAFHDRMSLIVSLTVGNASSGSDPILGADYWNTTNKYIVDYVHIYQIDGQDIFFTPREAVEINRTDLGER